MVPLFVMESFADHAVIFNVPMVALKLLTMLYPFASEIFKVVMVPLFVKVPRLISFTFKVFTVTPVSTVKSALVASTVNVVVLSIPVRTT